jgi:hypothetical protein
LNLSGERFGFKFCLFKFNLYRYGVMAEAAAAANRNGGGGGGRGGGDDAGLRFGQPSHLLAGLDDDTAAAAAAALGQGYDEDDVVGLYKLNSVHPKLKSAWFQPF